MVKAVTNKNDDCIWVKIKKEGIGGGQDIYLATVYISPEKPKDDRNESLIEIFEDSLPIKVMNYLVS